MLTKVMIATVAACGAAVLFAAPAAAQPGDNPCDLAATFLCRFVPMAPDLDHDVDLTQQLPPADPNAPLPDTLPVLDPCAAGCI